MALLARQAARAGLARPAVARRTLALPSRPVVRANATKGLDAEELKEKATVFANDTAAALKVRATTRWADRAGGPGAGRGAGGAARPTDSAGGAAPV
jgi:hypothetical protein